MVKIVFMRPPHRNLSIDLIRTLGIVLMVIFHFCFDLKHFGYHQWDIPNGLFWVRFRAVILALFLGCVGVGLAVAHGNSIRPRTFFRRLGKLTLAAMTVTAMSLVMFPDIWIYFGVLHFIALASVVSLPLAGRPWLAGQFGAGIVLLYHLGFPEYGWPFGYITQWLPGFTNDFVSPSPWLGVVWIGIAVGHSNWLRKDPLRVMPGAARIGAPGRHSLLIYLVHQPLLYGLFLLLP